MSSTNNIKFQINRVDSGGMEMVTTMNAIIAHNDLNENCIEKNNDGSHLTYYNKKNGTNECIAVREQ